MFDAFTIILVLAVSAYFILIVSFLPGWFRSNSHSPAGQKPSVRVSILVPCRNEIENLLDLSEILTNQDYPIELFEVIWIDDHSHDGTGEQLEKIVGNRPGNRVLYLTGRDAGKKAALKAGMALATGELILLTDADSRPGPQWVSAMALFFQETGTDLIAGPVVLGPATAWQHKIQKLEFLSLVASSVGAAGSGHPVMIQGPNIGVRAADYKDIVNNLDNRFISGDDVFLLQAMKRIPGKKIRYCLSWNAIVESKPSASIAGFLRQRQRWASKAKGYTDPLLILTSLLVFLSNLSILIALAASLAFSFSPLLPLLLFSLKLVADFPLLLLASRFFRCTPLLRWFLPVQILYPFYLVIAASLAMFGHVKWKQ